jgi:Predicted permease
MNEKRAVVAAFGLGVAAVIGYLVSQFIAAFTIAVFLYYSSRNFYHKLDRFKLPKQLRAVATIAFLVVPFLFLLSYTVVLLILEAQNFVQTYPVVESVPASVAWFDGVNDLPRPTIQGIIDAYQTGQLDPFIQFGVDHASFATSLVSGFFLNTFIITVVTYYLLIEGSTFRRWLLRFDDDDIVGSLRGRRRGTGGCPLREPPERDRHLADRHRRVHGYNAVVPTAVEVPYPVLSGALTGVASLIPVIGMKIVYVPLTIIAAIPVILNGQLPLLAYIAGFLVVAIVLVDTIPDIVLRPYLSGDSTHVGLLMLAYIFGPVVLGFYGLFFAPILLVLGFTFADTALPRLLGADAA